MRKFIIFAELRELESRALRGEITYSRMVELLNEKAIVWAKGLLVLAAENAEIQFKEFESIFDEEYCVNKQSITNVINQIEP